MDRYTYEKTAIRYEQEDRIVSYLTQFWYKSFTQDEIAAVVLGRGRDWKDWRANQRTISTRLDSLLERGVVTVSTRPGSPCRPYYTIGPVTQAIMSAKPSRFSNKSAVDNAGGACNNGAKILQCTHGEGEAHG